MKTLDLFHEEASDVGSTTALVSVRLDSAEDRARRIVSDIMKARHICVGAFSAGKDSSVLASVILLTGAELKTQGYEGLCCTSRKADEITPAPDAAMPWHPRAPCSGARVA